MFRTILSAKRRTVGAVCVLLALVVGLCVTRHEDASILSTFKTEKLIVTSGTVDAVVVTGDATLKANTTSSGTAERLFLQSTNPAQIRSSIQWLNSAGTHLYAMGNAFAQGTQDSFFLYNWTLNRYILRALFGATDVSFLIFGPTGNIGGIQYDGSTSSLQLVAGNVISAYVGTTGLVSSQLLGFGTDPSVTACGGAGAGILGEALAGEITFGAGATACTLNYPTYPLAHAPFCVFTPSNTTAAVVVGFYISARSVTSTTITATTPAGLPGASYTYICAGDGE